MCTLPDDMADLGNLTEQDRQWDFAPQPEQLEDEVHEHPEREGEE